MKLEAIHWRISNPLGWIINTCYNYLKWSRATYTHPYFNSIRGPMQSHSFANYAKLHKRIFFPDISGSLIKFLQPVMSLIPCRIKDALHRNEITFFGAITVPFLFTFFIYYFFLKKQPESDKKRIVLLISAFIVLWNITIVCLIDGLEGNRMRFCITPCCILFYALISKVIISHIKKSVLSILSQKLEMQAG